jgi:hypothetical protein
MLGREVMGIIFMRICWIRRVFWEVVLGEIDENLTSISDRVTIG